MFSLYRRNKIIFSGFGLFFIWIAPAASLAFRNLEYYFQQKAVMEEHWLYLPQIGIFIVAAYFIKKGLQYFNNQIYKILLILIMVSLSFITIRETGFWRDNYTFFTHTSKFVNYSSTVYRNLGWIYVNRNESSRAIDMYSRALGLKQPDKLKKVLNKEIAYVYFLNNQPKKAAEFCRQAIGLDSNYADAHACLGAIYSRDDLNSAIGEWKIALEQDPFNGLALNNLLNLSKTKNDIRNYLIKKYENLFNQTQYFERYRIYSVLGMIYLYSDLNSEALLYLQKASQINPYSVDINNGLAILYVNLKDYEKAIGFFKTTLKLNPFYRPAYDNLSLLYSRLNKSKQAELLLEKINSINMYE
jgi:tetratricopeptide (TPR) repeat protein